MAYRCRMRNLVALALVAALLLAGHAAAMEMLGLYQGRAIVTGTGRRTARSGWRSRWRTCS
jgi:hypothetical protein